MIKVTIQKTLIAAAAAATTTTTITTKNNSNNNSNNNIINDTDFKSTEDIVSKATTATAVVMCGQKDIDLLQRDKNRLIVVNDNKVYDLTDFARFHPGGSDILHEHQGQDISDIMKNDQFHRHSRTAYKILDKYYVGNYQDTDGTHNDINQFEEQRIKEKEKVIIIMIIIIIII